MSKSKHKYREDATYDDGVEERKPSNNRHKEKRLDRALRTKNISELIELDDEGLDPIDIEDEVWDDEILNADEFDEWMKKN